MHYLYLKALHIIFMVTWFAGMFYIVRLFIYTREAQDKPASERDILTPQLRLMSRRLWYGITFPSSILTLLMGSILLWQGGFFQNFGSHTWLHVKLTFVLGLYLYFYSLHRIFLQQQRGIYTKSGQYLRIWNELATIFLVSIVMLAVVKNTISFVWGLVGLVGLVIILLAAIKIYKQLRQQ